MKMMLVGDVCPTVFTRQAFIDGDVEKLFGSAASLFEGNDVNMVNLECALTDSDTPIEKIGPPLKAPAGTAKVLSAIGVNYAGLSNNHVFDFGKRGVRDTMRALDEAGIKYTGFGENYGDSRRDLVIEKDGERVAVIAVCEHEYSYALENRCGSRPFDEYDTMKDIRNAKKSADRVIVLYHGGKEHCHYPSPRLVKVCRAMADNGADVVLCQHTHCIGCYEKYEGCHILYGQGNFHFSASRENTRASWFESLAAAYDSVSGEIRFIPVVLSETGNTLAEGDDAKRILAQFEKLSGSLKDGSWRKGWSEFCASVADKYIKRVGEAGLPDSTERQNHVFAHYLDCEAHSDVLRELFKTANQTNEL